MSEIIDPVADQWLRDLANLFDQIARHLDDAHLFIEDEDEIKVCSNIASFCRQEAEKCRPPKYTDNIILFPLGR